MIGAHPDDEDTQLIAWLAKARHIETAYLSLTRGDGGQNLIGNELGPALGMIRTEELLAARRIDGGHQYFTRAYDFGFSKTARRRRSSTGRRIRSSRTWSAIVRAFRPQVIVSVWSGTPADGHGHHQFSGVVAREAFDAAGDTVRFPPNRAVGPRAVDAVASSTACGATGPARRSPSTSASTMPLLGERTRRSRRRAARSTGRRGRARCRARTACTRP